VTPEKRVKDKCTALLRKAGAWYTFPVQSGYGNTSGCPDILACWRGRFVAIECKATEKDKPTALQSHNLSAIVSAGGVALVINAGNVGDLARFLESSP